MWASNSVVDVVLGENPKSDETAWRCKMSSKMGFVEEFDSCPSWFETANVVSALAMPVNSGLDRVPRAAQADRPG